MQPARHFICSHSVEDLAKLLDLLFAISRSATEAVEFLVFVILDVLSYGTQTVLLADLMQPATLKIYFPWHIVKPTLLRSSQKEGYDLLTTSGLFICISPCVRRQTGANDIAIRWSS